MTPQVADHTAPDILSVAVARDPYPHYKRLRDDFPIILHPLTQSYILSRYADVERAFKEPAFCSSNYDWQLEPVHGRTLMQMEGKEHAAYRGLVSPAFRGRDLQEKFLPVIERNARELIDQFRQRGEVDLVAQFARVFPISVIVDILGLPKSDHQKFHGWYSAIVAFLANLSQDPEVTAVGLRAKVEFEEYMLPIIRERRANPGDDLLSTLCTAEIDGVRMSDIDIKSFCSVLLAAGGETTDKAIASMFKNLVAHPEQMAVVRADRSLIDSAFAETLRFSPPGQMLMRTTTTEVVFHEVTIPANSTVTCLLASANRDERQYRDPDTFNCLRDDLAVDRAFSGAAKHVAFGLGRHFCVGTHLARAEVQIGTNLLLDAMNDIQFKPGSESVDVGLFTRGPDTLHLTFTPA